MFDENEFKKKLTDFLKNCPSYTHYHFQYVEKEAYKYKLKVFFLDSNFIFCNSRNEAELFKTLEKKLKRSTYWKQYILNFNFDFDL